MHSRPRFPFVGLLTIAGLAAAGLLAFSAAHNVVRNYDLRREEASIQEDIARLEREREQLGAIREYVKSDAYVEETARRTLGLVRPGETLVIVSSSAPAAEATPAATPASRRPWWQELFIAPTPAGTPTPYH